MHRHETWWGGGAGGGSEELARDGEAHFVDSPDGGVCEEVEGGCCYSCCGNSGGVGVGLCEWRGLKDEWSWWAGRVRVEGALLACFHTDWERQGGPAQRRKIAFLIFLISGALLGLGGGGRRDYGAQMAGGHPVWATAHLQEKSKLLKMDF